EERAQTREVAGGRVVRVGDHVRPVGQRVGGVLGRQAAHVHLRGERVAPRRVHLGSECGHARVERRRELRRFAVEEGEQAADGEVEGRGVVAGPPAARRARSKEHGGRRFQEGGAQLGGERLRRVLLLSASAIDRGEVGGAVFV